VASGRTENRPDGARDRTYSLDGDFTVATAEGLLEGDFTVATTPGYVEAEELVDTGEAPAGVADNVFKAAMRVLPSGVVLATTRVDGRPWGLTISACCSISADPPQILISLRSTTISCREIVRSGRFGVSILGVEQKQLAEHGSAVGVAKFIDEFCETGGDCETLGSPMVADALFHLDCAVSATYAVSDHHLIVGLVTGAVAPSASDRRGPLLYFDRRFWSLGSRLE